jgi:hypothetical protein
VHASWPKPVSTMMDVKAMRKQKAKCNSSEKCRTNLDHVLVGSNTSGFESLGGKLLLLVAQHVHALRESIHTALLLAAIVNTKLWVGDTTAIARLDVRLVLLVAKAPSWTTAHLIRSASNERHAQWIVVSCFERRRHSMLQPTITHASHRSPRGWLHKQQPRIRYADMARLPAMRVVGGGDCCCCLRRCVGPKRNPKSHELLGREGRWGTR